MAKKNGFAQFIAAAGALAGGYMQGKKMNEDQEWENEMRQQKREDFARDAAEREIAANTLAKVGTSTVDPETAGKAIGVAPSMIEQDLADFGPEGAKATVNPATMAAAGVKDVPTKVYTREQADGDFVKQLYAINPAKAMQTEAQQLQVSAARDTAEQRRTERLIDSQLKGVIEKRIKKDDQGNPVLDADVMSDMYKGRAMLAAEHGRFDLAEKSVADGMQHNIRRIQMETATRTAETDAALRLFDKNPKAAMDVYNKFVPDGSKATDVIVAKDGTVTVTRESTIDGAKLPPQKFKNLMELRATVESIKDPNAVINHVERTFKHDLEVRRLNVALAAEGRAAKKDSREETEKKAKAESAVAVFKEKNPGASSAQLEAVRTGVMSPLPKEAKNEYSFTQNPLGMGGTRLNKDTGQIEVIDKNGAVTGTSAAPGSKGAPPSSEVFSPKTEDEFAKLPSGAFYIDPEDGKKYRKP